MARQWNERRRLSTDRRSRRRLRARRHGASAVAALTLSIACSGFGPAPSVIVIPAPPKMPEGAKVELRECCNPELTECPWLDYYVGSLGDFWDELDDLR